MEDLMGKYLYICTDEVVSRAVRWIVHRIKMSDVLSGSGLSFEQVANESHVTIPSSAGCGVFGSNILIGGGLLIDAAKRALPSSLVFCFETRTSNQKLKMGIFQLMRAGKDNPLLVEMKGELYALAGDIRCIEFEAYFEKFDPIRQIWQELPYPPIWDPQSKYYRPPLGLSYVITDTSILISRENTPVFRFDITNPEAGWPEQPCLCDGGPFPFRGTTLVHPCPYGGFIIFALDIEPERVDYYQKFPPTRFPHILVYHMTQDYTCLKLLETVGMELPVEDHHLLYRFGHPFTHQFIDLGGQRVCLVLSTFGTRGGPGLYAERDSLSFLVRTFEYKMEMPMKRTSEDAPVSFASGLKYLSDPVTLQHIIQPDPKPLTDYAEMLGAFVLFKIAKINKAE